MIKHLSDLGLTRRALVRGGAAAAATFAVARPFEALAQGTGRRLPVSPDYGELVDSLDLNTGLPLLQLPEGFRYRSLGWTGDALFDGTPTPAAHDGGAVLHGGFGRMIYVRNHEQSYSATGAQVSFAEPGLTYDAGNAPGGTTNVELDVRRGRLIRAWSSLSGTIRNCAGGATPWNSWLSCEENLQNAGTSGTATYQKDHGWVFEVPALRRARPEPIVGMGRFNHEATATDPFTGFVYETEDTGTSGLYRYVPRRYGRLHDGGKLQMLKVTAQPNLDTSTGIEPFLALDISWVDIADPSRRDDVAGDGLGVFRQGFALGGASFRRGEGIWFGNGKFYFTCTSGGAAGKGQIFELDPRRDTLTLIFESPGAEVLDNPDNITVSPRGGIVLCEDGSNPVQSLRGLTPDGEIFDFARNNVIVDGKVNGITGDFRSSEWAGAAFTPDGDWLIVNIQTPGITFAITGPWRRGAL